MNISALTLLFWAVLFVFPGGNCVPSPRYAFEFGMDDDLGNHLTEDHHRVRRKTGRGSALSTCACDTITPVPSDIRANMPLDDFYQKYTHAYGIPILSSSLTPDTALTRACYEVKFLLADRQDLRDSMFDQFSRVGVIAQTEQTTDIPEHSYLDDYWNERARGLGGVPSKPVSTDGEENVLCYGYPDDRWYEEDVLLHEFTHAIHLIGMNRINSSFQPYLIELWEQAKAENLWQYTYAITNYKEYFAEGVQGFFNVQTCRDFRDNVHNDICTRELLKDYDPRLYDLIVDVFPCMNTIVDRCHDDDGSLAANQVIKMNCDVLTVTTTETARTDVDSTDGDSTDLASTTLGNTTSADTDSGQSRTAPLSKYGAGFASLQLLVAITLLVSNFDF